jgi:hypothetical protein
MANSSRLFELRTYHAAPGKSAALHDRFRNHTLALFETHGLDVVGFWTRLDAEGDPTETLVYLLAFADRAAADKAWSEFRNDSAWIKLRAETEQDGSLVASVDSVYLGATDYSALH